ncbi:uroporphyrinogen-III synthase [Roseitranquillus sediminis]|uniref:uroporphyrinogen-III synthase n=1 Tax=Roseitranquillus sediminis TaxID=2809051 RepID=UPI001D0BFDF0|nr:uroporphyrinogen-III synthase [Roseitranquillus sediminis]MBM9596170.1 uroporphyrinogen-III synthase [Roseitranquillus sediminis]
MAPTLLLTRPREASLRFLKDLSARRGAAPAAVLSPVLEIRLLRPRLVRRYATLILTSRNGLAGGAFGARRAFCVGDGTAEMAGRAGLEALSADGDVEALIRLIRETAADGPLLHLRGAHAAGDLVARLRAAGLDADEAVAYDQAALPLTRAATDLLAGSEPVLLPLFSPRSAALVAAQAEIRAPLHLVAMSANVAEAWGRPAEQVTVAPRPTAEDMLAAVAAGLAG